MHALFEAGRDALSQGPLGLLDGRVMGPHVPQGADDLRDHYDLTLSHPRPDDAQFASFDRWLAQAAAARGLTCALLHEGVLAEATRRLYQGRLTIGLHLDYFALWHLAGNPYASLAQAVQDNGGRTINPPARARLYTDKAAAHAELLRRRLGVPATLLVRPWMTEPLLSPAARTRLGLDEPGARVYVKPANGFAGRGVLRVEKTDPETLANALRTARQHEPQDAYLIQREVRSPRLLCEDGVVRPAYWRILHCLGELLPFWWSAQEREHGRPSYRRVTAAEARRFRLRPVLAYAAALACLSRLAWFSTELCLSEGSEESRFAVEGPDGQRWPVVAVDYLNDQCDVDVQSRWLGAPPDAVVRYLAERFADTACGRGRRPVVPRPARQAA